LFTHKNDWESPICRGDNGESVPLYFLPGEHEDREKIYFLQQEYRDYDSIWMSCGELEIPVYKQLATPDSELSSTGRELCTYIEEATGIPTYYYMMRYWGRRAGEEDRKCPGCGKNWSKKHHQKTKSTPFHIFDFMCEHCRLVSHTSNTSDDERHAVIGEWRSNSP
jgi:predicted  nucleic acid-binding Zn ribbon protein